MIDINWLDFCSKIGHWMCFKYSSPLINSLCCIFLAPHSLYIYIFSSHSTPTTGPTSTIPRWSLSCLASSSGTMLVPTCWPVCWVRKPASSSIDCSETSHLTPPPMWVIGINSLWPIDAIWWHRSGSTFAQEMAWAPSHYLNQCWLIIREVQWLSYESNFTTND